MSERREPSRPTGVGQSGSPRAVLVHGSSLDVWDNFATLELGHRPNVPLMYQGSRAYYYYDTMIIQSTVQSMLL